MLQIQHHEQSTRVLLKAMSSGMTQDFSLWEQLFYRNPIELTHPDNGTLLEYDGKGSYSSYHIVLYSFLFSDFLRSLEISNKLERL